MTLLAVDVDAGERVQTTELIESHGPSELEEGRHSIAASTTAFR